MGNDEYFTKHVNSRYIPVRYRTFRASETVLAPPIVPFYLEKCALHPHYRRSLFQYTNIICSSKNNNPNWPIFSRMVETTNQSISHMIYIAISTSLLQFARKKTVLLTIIIGTSHCGCNLEISMNFQHVYRLAKRYHLPNLDYQLSQQLSVNGLWTLPCGGFWASHNVIRKYHLKLLKVLDTIPW